MPKKKQIEELPSNSKASRSAPIRESRAIVPTSEEIPAYDPPKRIAKARVIKQKKTLSQTIAEAFVGDGTHSVGSYILNDVLVPAFKSLVTDAVTSGVEMLVYGETKGGRSRGRDRSGPRVINYSSYSRRRDHDDDDRRERRRPAVRDPFDLNDIYFKEHTHAEDVLEELCDRVEEFETVSVADYFEIAGIEGATHVHYKWGWDDRMPKRAFCTHTRHGWAIVLPEPVELD